MSHRNIFVKFDSNSLEPHMEQQMEMRGPRVTGSASKFNLINVVSNMVGATT